MTGRSDLAAWIDRLTGARVLCVGDVMLDRFVYGTAERLSPEAPVPVLTVGRRSTMLGGAGNVARNLAALGCETHFVALVGEDGAGSEIAHLLGELDRVRADLLTDPGRASSVKTRFMAGTQQLLRSDEEDARPISDALGDLLVARARGLLADSDVLILSDYGKGTLSPAVIEALVALAGEAGKPVLVDPKGADYRRYRGAALVTPNRAELAVASGMPTGSDAEVVAAARAVAERCGIRQVLGTRGAEGMTLCDAEGLVHHVAAEAREVFDVSGAGDTVIAAVAAALAAGADMPVAMRLATFAAGIVVGKAGTAVAHPDEIAAALHRQDLQPGESKLATLDRAIERVATWRSRGHSIGFTNGCFDLLHPGHVALLGQARAACDRLVVGLNSDASVRRLKGEGRPIQGEAARATVLGSLSAVDMVVLFGEDTPMALIEALRPDLLVKGADYTVDTVVGADVVRGYGGRVLLADLLPGHSTTATVDRLKA